jgi:membrane protease YdiL (CAAX protease family)
VSGGGLPPAPASQQMMKARWCFALTVGALTAFTLARSFVPLGPSAVGISVLIVLLAGIAGWAGATREDLGLDRRDMRSGLLYGTAAFGIAAAIENAVLFLVAVSVIPATSGFLNDTRAHISGGRLLFELAVSITLLTAIPEEFAFRGVLLWSTLELTRQRQWRAILITSALFGLWHIAPTLHTMSDNPAYSGLTGGVVGQALLVLGNIGVTFIGGLVFGWLRVWSKSLIAPVMAHASADGLALTVAWFTVHHGSL